MDFLDIIGRYMAGRYVKFEDGQIWFGKERVAFNFLPVQIKEFLINTELDGPTYAATLFLSSRKVGYDFVGQHAIPLVKNFTPVVRMGFEWLELFGVGAYRPIKVNNEKGFVIAAGRSAFGLEMKYEKPGEDKPVDFVTGGLIAGALQYYVKKPMYAIETACVAQKGVQECVFIVGDRKEVVEYVKQFSPDKLDMANITLDQIEGVEKQMREKRKDGRWLV